MVTQKLPMIRVVVWFSSEYIIHGCCHKGNFEVNLGCHFSPHLMFSTFLSRREENVGDCIISQMEWQNHKRK